MDNIDLSKCKVGDKLKLRNGELKTFSWCTPHLSEYPSLLSDGSVRHQDGSFYSKTMTDPRDVVEIIGQKKGKTMTHREQTKIKYKQAAKEYIAKRKQLHSKSCEEICEDLLELAGEYGCDVRDKMKSYINSRDTAWLLIEKAHRERDTNTELIERQRKIINEQKIYMVNLATKNIEFLTWKEKVKDTWLFGLFAPKSLRVETPVGE